MEYCLFQMDSLVFPDISMDTEFSLDELQYSVPESPHFEYEVSEEKEKECFTSVIVPRRIPCYLRNTTTRCLKSRKHDFGFNSCPVDEYIRENFLGYLTLDQIETTGITLLSACRRLIDMSFPLRGVIIGEYDPYKFSEEEYNLHHRVPCYFRGYTIAIPPRRLFGCVRCPGFDEHDFFLGYLNTVNLEMDIHKFPCTWLPIPLNVFRLIITSELTLETRRSKISDPLIGCQWPMPTLPTRSLLYR